MNLGNYFFSFGIAAVERPMVGERKLKGSKGSRRYRYSTAAFTKATKVI